MTKFDMNDPKNYDCITKFEHSQRLFRGRDNRYYLADESGDRPGPPGCPEYFCIGFPPETSDGPMAIAEEKTIQGHYDDQLGWRFHVTCIHVGSNERCCVGVCAEGALFLATYLNMSITIGNNRYYLRGPRALYCVED